MKLVTFDAPGHSGALSGMVQDERVIAFGGPDGVCEALAAGRVPGPSGGTWPLILKGGSFRDEAPALSPAARLLSDKKWNARDPQIPRSKWWNTDAPFIGFRIVRPVKQPDAAAAEEFYSHYL